MTVRDIFELRKQGKIEEAYDAIRPMYAAHKGRYTSLCMFWTAADIFKKRLREGRTDEAAKIYEALKRVLPYIKDSDKQPETASDFHDDGTPKLGIDKEPSRTTDSAAAFMQTAARRLTQARQLEQLASSEQENLRSNEANSRELGSFHNPKEEDSCDSDNSCSEKEDWGLEKNVSAPSAEHKEESPAKEELEPSKEDSLDSDNSWSKKDNSSNSPLQEDLSGHLSVSLDEGIIRPIEGLTAIQRVVLACVVGHPGYSIPKISESTGIPQTLIERHVAVLVGHGLIEYRDSMQYTGYYPL